MVSLNTMRTHTKNIYAKLAVTSRRARSAEPRNSACREPATGNPEQLPLPLPLRESPHQSHVW